GAVVDPVVDRAPLHHHVAGLEMYDRIVELHVDLARDDHDVVDRIGPMVARRKPWRELDHAEDRPVRQGRADLAKPRVGGAVVVGRKAFGGPDVTRRRAGPPGPEMLADLVDLDDRAAPVVVAGDDSPYLKRHVSPPRVDWPERAKSSVSRSRAAMG